ncbi:hypothetical protein BB561_004564 [Smittium simulii]|uniref:RING-type E3 ubiquitin transferase n=1 Tax=Smittium simulii TaxID=133385 RepID=A0A2T9YFJ1_9FUNG|nr:hypothetical protein BB561_004564 [Smittium simulii]
MSQKNIQQWEHNAFSRILGVTLTEPAPNSPLFYLASIAAELAAAGSDPYLTQKSLEMAIIECLEGIDFSTRNSSSFTFLFESWIRAQDIFLNLSGPKGVSLDPLQKQLRLNSLQSLKNLLISYCGLSLQEDSLFSGDNLSAFLSLVISSPHDFADWFKDIITRFENDGFDLIVENITTTVNSKILAINSILNPQVFDYIKCLEFFLKIPQFTSEFVKIPWFVCGEAKEVQTKSVLGPLFSISPFPEEDNNVILTYFNGVESLSRPDQKATISTLRNSINLLQSHQFKIVNQIVRSSKFARDIFLKWCARSICSNIKRTGLQADPTLSASNGFAENLAAVLIQLSSPFSADTQLSKLDKTNIATWPYQRALSGQLDVIADQQYMNSSSEASEIVKNTWIELTKMCASTDEFLLFAQSKEQHPTQSTELGFISDCFYLTTLAVHIGPLVCISKFNQLRKEVVQLEEHIKSVQASIDNSAGSSTANPLSNMLLERWKTNLNTLKAKHIAMEACVMDPQKLLALLSFSRFVIASVLSLQQLAISSNLDFWKCFPEYMIEDQLSLILFVTRYAPDALMFPELSPPQPGIKFLEDTFVALVIAILSRPELTRNPYLKLKIVDALHSRFAIHPIVSQFIGSLNEFTYTHIESSPLLKKLQSDYPKNQLVMVLLRLYTDIEHTSSNNAFYDKFTVRYNISRILRSLWNQPKSQHLKATYNFFVNTDSTTSYIVEQFVSRIVSDTTFLLDESLTKLTKIKSLESGTFSISSEDQSTNQTNIQQELQSAEREASSYVTLAHETVHILSVLTRLVPGPFRSDSIVLRFAAMLNYNLCLLAGPKCRDLKVNNMVERFQFRPKIMLSEILSVYLHLSYPKAQVASNSIFKCQADDDYFLQKINLKDEHEQIERFIDSLAQDQRSWNTQVYKSSLELCSKLALKSLQSIQMLSGIATKVENSIKKSTSQDIQLGDDIPEEFLDPIMYTIMEDPVLLPTSQTIIDFKTIKGYLLTDPRDPFNRKPLQISQVEHLPDLKAQIEEFKQKQQSK